MDCARCPRPPAVSDATCRCVLRAGGGPADRPCAVRRPTAGAADARERAYRENNVGVARLEQYRLPRSGRDYRRALDADPRLAAARLNLGIALLDDSQLEDADREVGAALEQMPSAPQPPYARGLIARLAGREEDAAGLSPCAGDRPRRCRRQDSARPVADRDAAARRGDRRAAGCGQGRAVQRHRGLRPCHRDDARRTGRRQPPGDGTVPAASRQSGERHLFDLVLGQGRYAEALASTGLEPSWSTRPLPRSASSTRPRRWREARNSAPAPRLA